MSSTNALATSSSSPFPPEILDTGSDEEYVPLLTSRQLLLEDIDSEIEDEDETVEEVGTGSTRKRKRRTTRATCQELPPPPNFEPFIHSRELHKAFVRLPAYLNIGVSKPIDFFFLFFTPTMLDTIVDNTNLYASSKGAGSTGRCWFDFTRKELIIWIALIIYQGLYKLPSLEQYWNENGRLPIHNISRQMSLKRFEQIKRYLHISSPAATIKNYFDKLEPLLSHIRDVSKKFYVPSSNVSVDEMIIRFSGRSTHTVRIKNKPTPEGFKVLSLCDSGYTFTFLPTSRVVPSDVPKINGLNQIGCQVYFLVEQHPYCQYPYNVYMDNYFSNVPLFQHLRRNGIGACGTVRKTASGFPKELKLDKNNKLDWDVRSGVVVNGVLAFFWQDNGPVTMLSTIHGITGEEWEVERERRRPRETSTNATKVRAVFGSESKKNLKIPRIIDDYNHFMNGVDIADQLRSYYSTQKVSQRNWLPIFFWLLDTSIINAFRITRTAGSMQEQREFRQELIWDLVNYANDAGKMQLRNSSDLDVKRERVSKHFELSDQRFIPGNHIVEWREGRGACRLCAWLASKNMIEMDRKTPHRSQLWCVACNVPLCCNNVRNCFLQYHTNN
jgi:hypothetical protein